MLLCFQARIINIRSWTVTSSTQLTHRSTMSANTKLWNTPSVWIFNWIMCWTWCDFLSHSKSALPFSEIFSFIETSQINRWIFLVRAWTWISFGYWKFQTFRFFTKLNASINPWQILLVYLIMLRRGQYLRSIRAGDCLIISIIL